MDELEEMYARMGIEKKVYEYGGAVLEKLAARFQKIDEIAEYVRSVKPAFWEPRATAITIWAETGWRRFTPMFFTRRMRWSVPRSPAGPMRWRWR